MCPPVPARTAHLFPHPAERSYGSSDGGSYCAPLGPATLASCTHGTEFSAIVRQGNFHGTQFHPERSAKAGARILENFLSS
jgi:glutamine amidotransferase